MTFDDQRLKLHRHLCKVERPGRYLGGEINAVKGQPHADFRFCLLFPDLYDIGISYYGFQILYHLLNRMDGVVCERAYLPWPDMQRLMRSLEVPLYSLESGSPLSHFDAIGVTLQTETHYPGVVKALELAGIPIHSQERSGSDPVVIGGGPCAFHPEPVAPFFDAFLIGDAEEALPEMVERMRAPVFQRADRREKWEQLAGLDGVYVPGLYRPSDDFLRVEPVGDAPKRVKASVAAELRADYYPRKPLVPLVKGTHDRLTVELMRGCTRGCRFCQAGIIQRPVRERPVEEILAQVLEGLQTTGYDEVGLLSLSTSDYSRLPELMTELNRRLVGRHATLSFPSLRPSSFTEEIAGADTGGRRSSLTFAVEAGSQRLRDVINKALTEDELFAAVERAYRNGWRVVKLYFMVGLPTETPDDISEGAELLRRVAGMTPRWGELHVSVAPFIPKPHTVFEGDEFLAVDELERRQRMLLSRLPRRRVKSEWRDPERNLVEAVLARGDRRLAKVVQAVARTGDAFEAWGGCFSWERWRVALDELYPEWIKIREAVQSESPRPWSHLAKGVTAKFLKEDRNAAETGVTLPDCSQDECYLCGLMKLCDTVSAASKSDVKTGVRESVSIPVSTLPASAEPGAGKYRHRLTFSKLWRARFMGHHDLMRTVEMALLRAGVPLIYSQGFNPRPRISYGPALSLGLGAVSTWIEFDALVPMMAEEWLPRLRQSFPAGIIPWTLVEAAGLQREKLSPGRPLRYRLRYHRPVEEAEIAGLLRGTVAAGDNQAAHAMPAAMNWVRDQTGRTVVVEVDSAEAGFTKRIMSGNLKPDKSQTSTGSLVAPINVTRMD